MVIDTVTMTDLIFHCNVCINGSVILANHVNPWLLTDVLLYVILFCCNAVNSLLLYRIIICPSDLCSSMDSKMWI